MVEGVTVFQIIFMYRFFSRVLNKRMCNFDLYYFNDYLQIFISICFPLSGNWIVKASSNIIV